MQMCDAFFFNKMCTYDQMHYPKEPNHLANKYILQKPTSDKNTDHIWKH